MARIVLETFQDDHGSIVRLVSDTHDDPERTPRFFVESTLKFGHETQAQFVFRDFVRFISTEQNVRFISTEQKGEQSK